MKLTAKNADKLSGRFSFLKSIGSFFYEYRYVFLAFFAPLLLMAIAFALTEQKYGEVSVAPFGLLTTWYNSVKQAIAEAFPSLGITYIEPDTNPETMQGSHNMFIIDLWHQYYPFLVDFQDKLQSGGSLLWSWSSGMGTNFIATMSYYLLSPLNFFTVFIDESWLPQYLALATTIKIGLAGACTAIAFKIMFRKNGLHLVIFSTMYALCSFSMGYFWCVIWLDTWAILPLVVAGVVCLLRDGKYRLFIFSLAAALVFNYYIGFFVCIAVVFTAIGYSVTRFESFKKCFKDLLRSAVCTGISLLLTAPVTITAFLALKNCAKSSSGFPENFALNIVGNDSYTNKGVFEAFHQVISNTLSFLEPTKRTGLPNVACGTLCLILVAVFFCCRKIKLGEKIFCANMLVFFIASFIFKPLDFIWHAFHVPNELPFRYSFLFCFLMIYMAYRAYTNLEKGDIIEIAVGGLVFGLIVYGYFLRNVPLDEGQTAVSGSEFSTKALAGVIATGIVMLIILLLYVLKLSPRRITTALLCLVVVGEMCVVANVGVRSKDMSTKLDAYPKSAESVEYLSAMAELDSEGITDLWRTEFTKYYTINDGPLYGVNGVSLFSSMTNANISHFVECMGLSGTPIGNRYTYYTTSPVTNVLLNVKYLITRGDKNLDTVYLEEVDYHQNSKLYKNKVYLPQGFLANSTLADYELPEMTSVYPGHIGDPFLIQNDFWKAATGIEEPLYTKIEPLDNGADKSFDFSPESSALLCGYVRPGSTSSISGSFQIKLTDKGGNTTNVGDLGTLSYYHVHNLGYFDVNKSEKISLSYSTKEANQNVSVTVYCYALNEDVFSRGLSVLGNSTLSASEVTDTSIEGTITADRDGVLYTSIPYEEGWQVEVDGEKAEIIAIGDAMCAVRLTKGTHTVRFHYFPAGLAVGIVGFAAGVLILVFIGIFSMKRMKDNPVKKAVVWLFTPEVKENDEPFLTRAKAFVSDMLSKIRKEKDSHGADTSEEDALKEDSSSENEKSSESEKQEDSLTINIEDSEPPLSEDTTD